MQKKHGIAKVLEQIEKGTITDLYYSDETARQLEKLVNTAKQLMQEISVINYTKVA